MDAPAVILLGVGLFWILFCFGVIHGSRAYDRRREKRRSSEWVSGRSGSPTSNSRKIFELQPVTAEKKGAKLYVTGQLTGVLPKRNDVVYFELPEERFPVTVVRVRQLDMPTEQKGVRVGLTLAGVPHRVSAALSGKDRPKCSLTNLRKAEYPAPPSSQEKTRIVEALREDEIRYPVVVTASPREIIPSALTALFGLVCLVVFFYGAFRAPERETLLVIIGCSSLFIFGIAAADLFYKLSFRLTINRDRVEVRRWGRKTATHINNLRFSAALAPDKSEKWTMTIRNTAGGEFAVISNRSRRYEEAFEAFRCAEAARKKKERDSVIYRYLTDTAFYVSADVSIDAENGTAAAFPRIMLRHNDGTRTLFLYSRQSEAEKNGHPSFAFSITDAVGLMGPLRIRELLVLPMDDRLPKTITVTEESWNSLTAEFSAEVQPCPPGNTGEAAPGNTPG